MNDVVAMEIGHAWQQLLRVTTEHGFIKTSESGSRKKQKCHVNPFRTIYLSSIHYNRQIRESKPNDNSAKKWTKQKQAKREKERHKEPYRASMEAMEPPGTYSMKMFTTPPSKQVPMNLRETVRKSLEFTKDVVKHINASLNTEFFWKLLQNNGNGILQILFFSLKKLFVQSKQERCWPTYLTMFLCFKDFSSDTSSWSFSYC